MQSLHRYHPLLLPIPTSPNHKVSSFTLLPPSPPLRRRPLTTVAAGAGAGGFSSDEIPVDESFLEKFGPKEKESEDQARRRNWVERGWAPWEEVLSPEGYFARMSLNEGEEVPLRSPEAIEAFRLLSPEYRRKKMEESGLGEEDWYAHQFSTKAEVPDPITTSWNGPLAFRMMPPRDWPPRGWEVDEKELAFIRGAHRMQAERVELKDVGEGGGGLVGETGDLCLERYKVFLKQYKEWVVANRDRLEEESYKFDQDYYPGRRKRGKDYKEDMLELPFFYPGQICTGKVTTVHLYQGAFVDIGGVYDGWVPIKGNDWYWIRHHIKVGMHVIVEILAKRDPYLFRFPIEMRFVNPNIDHLIFNRFEFSPVFHRDEDPNLDELRRDCGRPPVPRKRLPDHKIEEQPLLSNHPYVDRLWQLHVAEQMILDDEEANPDKYKDKKYVEAMMNDVVDDEHSVEYTKAYFKKTLLPKMILKTNVKDLDLDAARAERKHISRLKKEAQEKGEVYKLTKLRRNLEMDEYDFIHWRRSLEEREALLRDISCRQALGLPLEEPGRYKDDSYFGKDQYDPTSPLYRYDYWGEPKNSEKSKQERMTDTHNKSIVGKGTVWYEMSYEEAIKQRMPREASEGRLKQMSKEDEHDDHSENKTKAADVDDGDDDDEDDDDEDDDFDYSILGSLNPVSSTQLVVNGTETFSIPDEDVLDD